MVLGLMLSDSAKNKEILNTCKIIYKIYGARKDERTKGRWDEGTKERRHERTKARGHEGGAAHQQYL
jgi:hypothetical protein